MKATSQTFRTLARVPLYRYLGVCTNPDYDITIRVGQAWTQIRSLKERKRRILLGVVMESLRHSITTPNKILLFKTLILPVLLYGTPTYPLTNLDT